MTIFAILLTLYLIASHYVVSWIIAGHSETDKYSKKAMYAICMAAWPIFIYMWLTEETKDSE